MLYVLGAVVGFYILYAIIALITKHETGLIVASILGVLAGIYAGISKGNYITLLGTIVGFLLIFFIVPLQIKSKKKDEWKTKRAKTKLEEQNITESRDNIFKKVPMVKYEEQENPKDFVKMDEIVVLEKAFGVVTYEKVNLTKGALTSLRKKFIAFDTETTGLSATYDRIIELGAVVFEEGMETTHFSSLVNPNILIPASATQVNHITNDMIAKAPGEEEIYKEFSLFFEEVLSGKVIMCAHNASFDVKFVANALMRMGYSGHIKYIDTLGLSRKYIKTTPNHKQSTIAQYFKIVNANEHRASDDALTCGKILLKLLNLVEQDLLQSQK